jgi:hypothetical protein
MTDKELLREWVESMTEEECKAVVDALDDILKITAKIVRE